MSWVHDTGYAPAYAHEGYPVMVVADGAEALPSHSTGDVIGWRAACDCGWRSPRFSPRAAGSDADPPAAVEGFDTGGGLYGEWSQHLHRVLPELAVHDSARDLAAARARLDNVVRAARRAGRSWQQIGSAAGISADRAARRWAPTRAPAAASRAGRTPDRETMSRRRGSERHSGNCGRVAGAGTADASNRR